MTRDPSRRQGRAKRANFSGGDRKYKERWRTRQEGAHRTRLDRRTDWAEEED